MRISYHGLGMHAGLMDAKQGLLVAFAHGPKEFTMRYQADVPHAQLLGTNPWADVGISLPPPPARCSKPVRAIWRRGRALPPALCLLCLPPRGRGVQGPSPLFRLRLCRTRHAPEGHDPGRSATGNSLSGGDGGGHPGTALL